MLSYKKWKTLNESYDTSLGLSTPQAVGIMSNAGATLEELIAERKKMKKKMLGERPDMSDEDEDETGDGEMVEPTSLKDKIQDDDDHDDDDDDDDDHDHDDDDHDDDDHDHDDDDHDDDHEEGGNPLLSKIQMMKKKMKNKMKKKCSSGKMKKKMKKEETEPQNVEDNSFIQSISKMMSGGDGQRNWDGISPKNEDALLPIIDPNTGFAIGNYGDAGLAEKTPQAGEVGFAPQGKIGDFFGN